MTQLIARIKSSYSGFTDWFTIDGVGVWGRTAIRKKGNVNIEFKIAPNATIHDESGLGVLKDVRFEMIFIKEWQCRFHIQEGVVVAIQVNRGEHT